MNTVGTAIRALAAAACILFLPSCSTTLGPVGHEKGLSPLSGYIAGSFHEEPLFLQKLPSDIKLILKNDLTGKEYSIRFGFGDELKVMALPPGRYRFTMLLVSTKRPGFLQTELRTEPIPLPAACSGTFTVTFSEIVYIGSFKVSRRWKGLYREWAANLHFRPREKYLMELRGGHDFDPTFIISDLGGETGG